MNLRFEQIRAVTHGAAQIRQEDGGIRFFRLTEAQLAAFLAENEGVANTAAGIKLVFRTNSTTLELDAFVEGTLYWWPVFSFDVEVDGKTIGHADNFSHIENFVPKFDEPMEYGPVHRQFDLGAGDKVVTLHLPWCKQLLLRQIALDDGAYAKPVRKKKLLLYGDSITQGYCSTRPSHRMAARLAAALDMEECNRAVAGSKFLPEAAAVADPENPDLITVAYGTNDWAAGRTAALLEEKCLQFLQNLRIFHPHTPIVVISPVPRINFDCSCPCIDYKTVTASIRTAAEAVDGVFFLDGSTLLPENEALLFDGLHPNDQGMALYAQNLARSIRKLL